MYYDFEKAAKVYESDFGGPFPMNVAVEAIEEYGDAEEAEEAGAISLGVRDALIEAEVI